MKTPNLRQPRCRLGAKTLDSRLEVNVGSAVQESLLASFAPLAIGDDCCCCEEFSITKASSLVAPTIDWTVFALCARIDLAIQSGSRSKGTNSRFVHPEVIPPQKVKPDTLSLIRRDIHHGSSVSICVYLASVAPAFEDLGSVSQFLAFALGAPTGRPHSRQSLSKRVCPGRFCGVSRIVFMANRYEIGGCL